MLMLIIVIESEDRGTDVRHQKSVEELQAGLAQFAEIANDLKK